MTFTVEITDSESLRGITAAREAYNASLSEDSADRLADDAAYVQFVMSKAAESYAAQYPVSGN